MGRLQPLGGMTVTELKTQLPGSFWNEDTENGSIQLLNRPSWLLYDIRFVGTFLRLFYLDPAWVELEVVDHLA